MFDYRRARRYPSKQLWQLIVSEWTKIVLLVVVVLCVVEIHSLSFPRGLLCFLDSFKMHSKYIKEELCVYIF